MKDLRERTYEILGLPIGSLTNEGGRDWNEAYSEAQRENNKLSSYINAEITENDIDSIVASEEYSDYYKKKYVSDNFKLSKKYILELIKCNDNDVILSILRKQEIDSEIINMIEKKNTTYMVNKEIEAIWNKHKKRV